MNVLAKIYKEGEIGAMMALWWTSSKSPICLSVKELQRKERESQENEKIWVLGLE